MSVVNNFFLPTGYFIKDYKLISVLGSGGFGVTYKAEDVRDSSLVAIKEYIPVDCAIRLSNLSVAPRDNASVSTFRKGVDSFIQEAQTLATFNHPNIVPIYRFFALKDSTAYFVMPFFAGKTLAETIKLSPYGRQSEAEIRLWLVPLLEGLRTIHKESVLHRDLKPENIFICDNGTPLLIDFGSARNALALHSKTLSAVLTPGYAPPEQYSSVANVQGPWTDMYALGAVIYYSLTGAIPENSPERQYEIINGNIDPLGANLHKLEKTVSSNFLRLIEKCLALQRKNRIQSVYEFNEYLHNRATMKAAPEPQKNDPLENKSLVSAAPPSTLKAPWVPPAEAVIRQGYPYFVEFDQNGNPRITGFLNAVVLYLCLRFFLVFSLIVITFIFSGGPFSSLKEGDLVYNLCLLAIFCIEFPALIQLIRRYRVAIVLYDILLFLYFLLLFKLYSYAVLSSFGFNFSLAFYVSVLAAQIYFHRSKLVKFVFR